jgi:D-sedoheptulose 7-phosphate isomerase
MEILPYSARHLNETVEVVRRLDIDAIERLVGLIARVREAEGRIFFVGVGGSAANCSHAVNDFRKLADIECYAPTDNVSELTARINDDGWSGAFASWLRVSRFSSRDLLFVMSVGGGDRDKNVSPNLVEAIDYARSMKGRVAGIVGRDGGHCAKHADACVIVPTVSPENVTPHAEAFQAVIWHLIVSHPLVKRQPTKWESVAPSPEP